MCDIKLSSQSIAGGQPITATYTISGADFLTTYWETERTGPEEQVEKISGAPAQGSSTAVFAKKGRVRFVVDTTPIGAHHTEVHPAFRSAWVDITSDAVNPVTVSIDKLQGSYPENQLIPLSWQISGGTAPYEVTYTLWNKHRGEAGHSFEPITMTQSASGTGWTSLVNQCDEGAFGYVVVQVRDAKGSQG